VSTTRELQFHHDYHTYCISITIKTTSTHAVTVVGVASWPLILTGWPAGRLAGDGWWWAWSANQQQTLSGTGARVLGVMMSISAASTGGVLVHNDTPCQA